MILHRSKPLRLLLGGMIVMVAAGWTYLTLPQAFFSFDNRIRDFLFLMRGAVPHSNRVVIVDINERCLREQGQWPWPRDKIALLIENLTEAGAGIIGMDMVFAEPDRSSPKRILDDLGIEGFGGEDYDKTLAKTLEVSPVVGGYFFLFQPTPETRTPLVPAIFIEKGHRNTDRFVPQASGIVLNTPVVQDAYYTSGFFNNLPDEGGMTRHVPLVMRYDDQLYPSLVLEMVRLYAGTDVVRINNTTTGVRSIAYGDVEVPTDRFGRLSINFRGPSGTFPYISATDVLSGHFDKEAIAGKFVLIGVSAQGLFDLRATPFDEASPGVEVHANVIDNLLQGDFISRAEDGELIDLAVIAGVVILAFALFSRVRLWGILPLFCAMLAGLHYFFTYMLFSQGVILNMIFPLLALVASLILVIVGEYIVTHRQKKLVMNAFAKKVSPAVMKELVRHADERLFEPVDREVSIFFSDIRSFTSISESMGSPSRVIRLLNRYMTPMVELIVKEHGTVDKFIGDAIMAYWNAPNTVEAHADRAVQSALEQINRLEELNDTLKNEFGVTLRIGIGINTGIVTVGEMGSEGRSDYTIIGDHVNLASRLEGLNKVYGSQIIISEHTKRLLQDEYRFRSLDIVRVKGKNEAVEIFEILPLSGGAKEEEIAAYHAALQAYRDDESQRALEGFETLFNAYADPLYSLYAERCRDRLAHPDEPFDVIQTRQSK